MSFYLLFFITTGLASAKAAVPWASNKIWLEASFWSRIKYHLNRSTFRSILGFYVLMILASEKATVLWAYKKS